MKVRLETKLPVPAEAAFAAVTTPRLLEHVAAPLLRFRPLDPPAFPDRWTPGRYRVAMRAFGLVPLGRQWIEISFLEPDAEGARGVRDNGSGDLVRVWDHLIRIRRLDGESCLYRDEVEVKAGLLTPFIWAFAQLFYRHRQRRWRALAARGLQEIA
jgi:hypothetical protein